MRYNDDDKVILEQAISARSSDLLKQATEVRNNVVFRRDREAFINACSIAAQNCITIELTNFDNLSQDDLFQIIHALAALAKLNNEHHDHAMVLMSQTQEMLSVLRREEREAA